MAQMLRIRKTCKPPHTSFNSQKKCSFRSSVVTSMCATPARNQHLFSHFVECITYLTNLCRLQTRSGIECVFSLHTHTHAHSHTRMVFSCAHTQTHTHTLKRLRLADSFHVPKPANATQKGGVSHLHTHTHTHSQTRTH